uniref:CCHC-type domain-containing protein n=1 Tax=Oryzias latipes TaxID=8090 RepID=A0A3P9GYV5_ORYLA
MCVCAWVNGTVTVKRFGPFVRGDRLVCGINDDRIQRELLAEEGLTFDRAFKMAVAMEAASRDVEDLRSSGDHRRGSLTAAPVLAVSGSQQGPPGDSKKCFRCGGTNHLANDCRFASEKCHNCGKMGHIRRVCRMRLGDREKNKQFKGGSGRQTKQTKTSVSELHGFVHLFHGLIPDSVESYISKDEL